MVWMVILGLHKSYLLFNKVSERYLKLKWLLTMVICLSFLCRPFFLFFFVFVFVFVCFFFGFVLFCFVFLSHLPKETRTGDPKLSRSIPAKGNAMLKQILFQLSITCLIKHHLSYWSYAFVTMADIKLFCKYKHISISQPVTNFEVDISH